MNVFFVACKVKQRKINILSVVKYASFTKIFFYLGRKFIPRRFNIGIYKLDRRYAGFFIEFSVRSFCRYFSRLYAALGKLPLAVSILLPRNTLPSLLKTIAPAHGLKCLLTGFLPYFSSDLEYRARAFTKSKARTS